jgi:hypothetical protein
MAVDLVNLGFAQIYLTLMIDGIGSSPFSAVTLPPLEHKTQTFKDQIVEASRQQFARPRAEVEEAIHIWHAPIADEPKERPADKEKKEKTESRRQAESPVKDTEKVSSSPTAHRTERPRDDRPREKKPASDYKTSSRDVDGAKRTTATKSMEELRAVLRQISKSDTPDKPPAPADLKSALASVLPAAVAAGPEMVEATASPDTDSELDPKKLERMMRVKTDDRTPLK